MPSVSIDHVGVADRLAELARRASADPCSSSARRTARCSRSRARTSCAHIGGRVRRGPRTIVPMRMSLASSHFDPARLDDDLDATARLRALDGAEHHREAADVVAPDVSGSVRRRTAATKSVMTPRWPPIRSAASSGGGGTVASLDRTGPRARPVASLDADASRPSQVSEPFAPTKRQAHSQTGAKPFGAPAAAIDEDAPFSSSKIAAADEPCRYQECGGFHSRQ